MISPAVVMSTGSSRVWLYIS